MLHQEGGAEEIEGATNYSALRIRLQFSRPPSPGESLQADDKRRWTGPGLFFYKRFHFLGSQLPIAAQKSPVRHVVIRRAPNQAPSYCGDDPTKGLEARSRSCLDSLGGLAAYLIGPQRNWTGV